MGYVARTFRNPRCLGRQSEHCSIKCEWYEKCEKKKQEILMKQSLERVC